jgi:hypothetical protein
MAAFSLWQLLNQRHPFPGDDPSDPAQQRQASGQAIGQSLNDFWDRAQADPLDDLVWRPGSVDDGSSPRPMPLPNYVGDSSNDGELPLLMPLGGRYPPAASTDPQPDGQPWTEQFRDPNIHSAGLERPAIDIFKYGLPALGAALEALLKSRQNQPQPTSPPPARPDSLNTSPDQTAPTAEPQSTASPEWPASASPELTDPTRPPIPGLAVSPSVPSPTSQSTDFLSWLYRRTPEEEAAFPGDYSNGFHKALQDAYIGSLRQRGCLVEPQVRFNEWGDPRYAIADWVARCARERLPNVNDAKTGPWARFTPNQNRVYPAIEAGNGYSDDPKMATFGLAPGRIPALVVNRIWSNPRGATPIVDRPFGPMQ